MMIAFQRQWVEQDFGKDDETLTAMSDPKYGG